MEEIRNKVKESGLIQFDLSSHWVEGSTTTYDLADDLWQGIALKEKDFRAKLKSTNWEKYANLWVGVHCSVDAIVPTWAFMLVASYLNSVNANVVFGNQNAVNTAYLCHKIAQLNESDFQNGRVIIKGCSDLDVSDEVYISLMNKLQPVAKSIMFGEPCSTVPLFKRK